jgi:flagellar protein FliL
MAKKPVNKAADDGEEGGAEKKSGGRKKLLLGGLLLVLLAGGGGGYFMFGRAKHGDEHKVVEKKPVAFVDIREMIVNLAPEPTGERQRFLKFKVSLEVNDPKVVANVEPLLPRVEDIFQVFVRELRASDLEGSGGIHRLREELLRRVNVAVAPTKVDAVLFKEVIVQ